MSHGTVSSTNSGGAFAQLSLGTTLHLLGRAFEVTAREIAERARLVRLWWRERNRMPWWLPDRVLGSVCYPVDRVNVWGSREEPHTPSWTQLAVPRERRGLNDQRATPGRRAVLARPARIDVARLRGSQVGGAR